MNLSSPNSWKMVIPLVILLILNKLSRCQPDTLNQFNSNGHKSGYWKTFLDKDANPSDSAKAYFYGYSLWDDGTPVFKYRKHRWRYEKIIFNKELTKTGQPILLDGGFKWYDKNGLLISEETYKEGHPAFIKSYKWDKKDTSLCIFNEILDFKKQLKKTPGTCYYEEWRNGSLIMKGWYRKGKNGWRVYPE